MEKETAVSLFESLSSGVRLDIFRLLVPHGEAGQVAGEIVTQLGLPPTNVSFHLKAMTRAGLLHVRQEGRFQRYRADLPKMQELIAWLDAECRPAPVSKPSARVAGKAPRKRSTTSDRKAVEPATPVAKPTAPNLTFDF
ncbi:ArsR/SmtB family transcription factor [Perlucidibaca piscinae]|uniref:ArsR/SmtB family transcription factor n=1 Tax=Perlucidibaca piscinae TaxID=392589 RepID=UPI0003B623AC|nr:metalloregulator ArsR/SmtB family transcription factor [Perlucidibaca piscinae]